MRVLLLCDNNNWIWKSQCMEMCVHLPEHEKRVATADGWLREWRQLMDWADLIYMRGYPFIYLKDIPQDKITKPYIYTIPTGGANIDMRIEQSKSYVQLSSACVVQNKLAYEKAVNAGFKNVVIIPNGIDTNLFVPAKEKPKEFTVGFAGNNRDSRGDLKGTPFVKEACEKLGIKYIEANFENRIEHNDMPKFYQQLSVYAQPSESEGMSNSVLEAQSCGLPCLIVNGVGYHGEVCDGDVLSDKANVYFVQRTVESIAEALINLKNYSSYGTISKNARQFALQFDWKIMIDQYRDIINKAVKEFKFEKTCGNCECWRRTIPEDNGICLRYPPLPDFPYSSKHNFCYEWRLK